MAQPSLKVTVDTSDLAELRDLATRMEAAAAALQRPSPLRRLLTAAAMAVLVDAVLVGALLLDQLVR